MSESTQHRVYPLGVLIIFVLGGGYLVAGQIPPGEWYEASLKPGWQPASWVVASSWLLSALLSASAAWLVWRRRSLPAAGPGLFLWVVQLVLAVAWWWMFFGLHRPGWALGGVLLLWITVALTLVLFHGTRRLAAWLMLPWLIWVTVAAALNYELWRLNGGGIF